MKAIFQSALRKLPSDLAMALESSGLDDASTQANYPRLTLVELQSRGFCVALVTETGDTAGTTTVDTDVGTSGTLSGIGLSTLSSCYRPFLSFLFAPSRSCLPRRLPLLLPFVVRRSSRTVLQYIPCARE